MKEGTATLATQSRRGSATLGRYVSYGWRYKLSRNQGTREATYFRKFDSEVGMNLFGRSDEVELLKIDINLGEVGVQLWVGLVTEK